MQAGNARSHVRTMHASFVIMFLLIFVIFGLGAYETLAAIINPSASVVLPLIDRQTRISQLATNERPGITVLQPTTVFSAAMDPLRFAAPGERYQVLGSEPGWALVLREGDGPDRAVWLQLDARLQAPGLVPEAPDPIQEGLIAIVLLASALLVTLLTYYGIRRRIHARRAARAPRRRLGAVSPKASNERGRLTSAS